MDRIDYHQTCRFHKKVGFKPGENKSQEWIMFFERFENDACFKIVWKRNGAGGECEEHSITKISLEDYDKI